MEGTIFVAPEDIVIIDADAYNSDVTAHFSSVPEIAQPLIKGAKRAFKKIEKMLYTAPAFIQDYH